MVDLASAGEILIWDVMLARVQDVVEIGAARRVRAKGVSVPRAVRPLWTVRGAEPESPPIRTANGPYRALSLVARWARQSLPSSARAARMSSGKL
jgi:hypothetical protein